MIMELGKSTICRVGWKARDSGDPMFQFKSVASPGAEKGRTDVQMKFKGSMLDNFLLMRLTLPIMVWI